MTKHNWQTGTFRILLKTGSEFTFQGRLRLASDDEGYLCEWWLDTSDVILHPHLTAVAVILRVAPEADAC